MTASTLGLNWLMSAWCGRGIVGHVEAIASGTRIAAAGQAAPYAGVDVPHLRRITEAVASAAVTASDVSDAADPEDPAAILVIEWTGRAVALAVVSIVTCSALTRSSLAEASRSRRGSTSFGPARRAVAAWAFRTQAARDWIVQAALGEVIGLKRAVPLIAAVLPELTPWP